MVLLDPRELNGCVEVNQIHTFIFDRGVQHVEIGRHEKLVHRISRMIRRLSQGLSRGAG
jgi:hypothetical protein